MTYAMVLERGDDGGWGASFPFLEGLYIFGDSRAEVLKLAPEAILEHLASLRDSGAPVPTNHVEVVEVEVPASGPVRPSPTGRW